MCTSHPNIQLFGHSASGEPVHAITLENGHISCQILTYGATIRTLSVPDRHGNMLDIVLGYDSLQEYEQQDGYLGAVVGRFANRIAYGHFSLNDRIYKLAMNNGENHLHGGNVGFSHRVWSIESLSDREVTLGLVSFDGEEGYPGTLHVYVTYTLNASDLSISYRAVCDHDTICNLTNHSYFNLAGHHSGTILDQEIKIFARNYTPTNVNAIPTGIISPVFCTPMDLTRHQKIGHHVDSHFPQLAQAGGYDHNYVITGQIGVLRPAAAAFCHETGIAMAVGTTLPGVQFYTGNFLPEGRKGKSGSFYGPRHGFCLETQFFPDSPNQPHFPSACLKAGEIFDHRTVFTFSVQDKFS